MIASPRLVSTNPARFAPAARLELWAERHRQRRALLKLGDHTLKDIGVSHADAWQEASKPFWQR